MNPPESMPTQYFLTLNKKGDIQGWASLWPPKALLPNQVELTLNEFNFLNDINGDLIKARTMIRSIEKKLQRNKK